MIIKPVRHILRGINLMRSINPSLFIPTWAVIFLFEPSDGLSLNWGERIYKVTWDVTNPDVASKDVRGN